MNWRRWVGLAFMFVGALSIGWVITHFNSEPVLVWDSILTPGRSNLGVTQWKGRLVGGIFFLWWGYILASRAAKG
jgi:hypothetical protein